MVREIGRSGGTFTNLSLKRSTTASTSTTFSMVVIVGHGTALAMEVLGIKGHLAVLGILINRSVDNHVVLNRELVDSVHTFRNLRERQGVVIVQFGRSNLRRNARIAVTGINGAKVVGFLPNIGNLGSVELNRDRPDVSGTITFGNGYELTLNQTRFSTIGRQYKVNIVVASYKERQVFTADTEHAIIRREVENVDNINSASRVHGEVEGGHPSTDRTNT